ncbi:PadR family transcriptional regulator [Paracidovorax avenae]|uniref:PadR family transcriptional regulator n=1 Tax=Paracidovorax avenae TaxID=80867 RepID=UPI000D150DFD|nr:PadR family transcriptional regulator [Paracidovorax avenae]AVS86468.1 PadR family transcriptional regulator [Paracidovorax avenae]AVS92993.1 PadR family transcriptional regulator [Paracidovorax avenae]AVT22175.1 PadR family transcriptional regulator [Paracidovorax avenae]
MKDLDLLESRGAPPGPRRGGGRFFGHGGLRLVLLQLIADKPRHGYELIKAIEERLGGSYSPSPGVVYPTLTLLEELGHVTVSAEGGGRKLHTATPEGLAHLESHRDEVDALLARMADGMAHRGHRPAPVERAVHNLRQALHMRLAGAPLDTEQIHAIADLLDDAARRIERL